MQDGDVVQEGRPRPRWKPSLRLKLLAACAVGLGLATLFASKAPPSAPPSAEPAVVSALDRELCPQTIAYAAFQQQVRAGIVRGRDIGAADGPLILVDAAKWGALSLDDQRRVAAWLDCAAAGPGNNLASINVRASAAAPDLNRYAADALAGLRDGGFAKAP